MVDTLELKAQISRRGMTAKQVYSEMGMTKRVWYDKMQKKKFDSDEMYRLIKILNIENPAPIFFADEVTQ